MTRHHRSLVVGLLAWTVLCLATVPSGAVTRDTVIATAKAYAYHPWHCTAANLSVSCTSGYTSAFTPGDYLGLPYDWAGYKSLFQFDQEIAQGYGAGSPPQGDDLDCTTGVDCSGFVSKCWHTSHYGTVTIQDVSAVITQAQLLPGDAMNKPGTHIKLFAHLLPSGEPAFYHAGIYNVEYEIYKGWSGVSGYTPTRYDNISGTASSNPVGTTENPIPISSFPYTDSRSTVDSPSDVLDGCNADPSKNETGPEYIYKVTFTQPGTLTVSVSDGPGTNPDIDVHLYTSMNTNDCVARHDSTFSHPVDCGTYYIVADSYADQPGAYTLTVDFAPSGGACGSGPPGYDFQLQEVGGACDATCNPNLGLGCFGFLLCSKPCNSMADCSAFAGGCCKYIPSKGGSYCLDAAYCQLPVAAYSCQAGSCSQPTPDCLASFFCTKPCTSPADCSTGCCGNYCLPASVCGVTIPTDAGVPPADGPLFWPDGNGAWPDGYVPPGDGYWAGREGGPPPGDGAMVGGDGTLGDDGGDGCGCRVTGRPVRSTAPTGLLVALALALGLVRRRGRRS